MTQPYYAKDMKFVSKDASFDKLSKRRFPFSLLKSTKSDVLFGASREAKVSNQTIRDQYQ